MRRISANYVFPVTSPPIRNGIVELDDDGRIIRVTDPGDDVRELRRMEFHNGILVPGFVNAHCHLELSCLKNQIPRHTGLPEFLRQVYRLRDATSSDSVSRQIKEADQLMRHNGIVACGDISNTPVSFAVKSQSAIRYHSFIELFGLTRRQGEKNLLKGEETEHILKNYGLEGNFTPHAPYSTSNGLLRALTSHEHLNRRVFSLHYLEASKNKELLIRMAGKLRGLIREKRFELTGWRPFSMNELASCLSDDAHNHRLMLVHNIHASGRHISRAGELFPNLTWVLCPNSNSYIHDRIASPDLFRRMGQRVALGTDSPASNPDLSILAEMKTLHQRYPHIPFHEMLQWATLNGAFALGLEKEAGALAPSLAPGINLLQPFDFTRMHLRPDSRVVPIS